ncbi:hypothetical protein BKA93DRAFT_753969 [Sparassis latifolia]
MAINKIFHGGTGLLTPCRKSTIDSERAPCPSSYETLEYEIVRWLVLLSVVSEMHRIKHDYSLKIGSTLYGRVDNKIVCTTRFPDFKFFCDMAAWPFLNLRSFECVEGSCTPEDLDVLRGCPHLATLALAWRDIFAFPNLDGWPELEVLRIYPYSSYIHRRTVRPATHMTFNRLTTLVVQDAALSPWWNNHFDLLTFPNLHVLSLQDLISSPNEVYGFIERHPSLRECNISFHGLGMCLSFEALMMLIEGTGIWTHHNLPMLGDDHEYEEEKSHQTLFDSPYFHEPPPDERGETYIRFSSFAFARVPFVPDFRLTPREARYKVTALALPVMDQETWIQRDIPVTDIPGFMRMVDRFPEMQELRLASATAQWYETFTYFMNEIAAPIGEWTHLRKLSLCYEMPHCWSWGPENDEVSLPACDIFVLDDVEPPVYSLDKEERPYFWDEEDADPLKYWKPHRYAPMNLRYLREEFPMEMPAFEEALRWTLRVDDDVDIDPLDRNVIIHAWEIRHAPRCARKVRYLAERSRTLEEFEWFLNGPHGGVRWMWKIQRGKDGRIWSVTGDLNYVGSVRGNPPPFLVLVGQELQTSLAPRSLFY